MPVLEHFKQGGEFITNEPAKNKTDSGYDAMKKCFVIMPIGSGQDYYKYQNRYENIIKPAVERIRTRNGKQLYECIRADTISKTGLITQDILEHLYNSHAVIADISDLNPNVFYELGVRHSLSNRTILLASKGTPLPFDVSTLRIVFYEDVVGGERVVIPKIQKLLLSFLEKNKRIDSPVFLAIPKLRAQSAKFYFLSTKLSLWLAAILTIVAFISFAIYSVNISLFNDKSSYMHQYLRETRTEALNIAFHSLSVATVSATIGTICVVVLLFLAFAYLLKD